jgi:dimethylsulfone monooxygenase
MQSVTLAVNQSASPIGCPMSAVVLLSAISSGVDLVLTAFLHFQEEVEYFGKRVLPIVRELEQQRSLVAA